MSDRLKWLACLMSMGRGRKLRVDSLLTFGGRGDNLLVFPDVIEARFCCKNRKDCGQGTLLGAIPCIDGNPVERDVVLLCEDGRELDEDEMSSYAPWTRLLIGGQIHNAPDEYQLKQKEEKPGFEPRWCPGSKRDIPIRTSCRGCWKCRGCQGKHNKHFTQCCGEECCGWCKRDNRNPEKT